jgi:secernin
MCDTMAATREATTTGGTLFAKNSDRERNEAQFLDYRPRRRYGKGAVVRATYIAIPQPAETHAVLLSRPFWTWGAEMGVNEHGVAIGNEAVHPRLPPQRREALIGMDLVRLGLERGATAAEATSAIIEALERHGQGGSCGHLRRRWYDNSFIVADAHELTVLETVGRHWAVQRVQGTRSISNTYTIGTDFTACSAGAKALAREQGWWRGGEFDFSQAMTDPHHSGLEVARSRYARSTSGLAERAGRLDAAAMMALLRDHGEDGTRPHWHPEDVVGGTICMHAGDGRRRSQSVGSLVCDLRDGAAVHWVTGTAGPCTGIFKPVFIDAGLPDLGPQPGDLHDPATLWWQHEVLHRAMLRSDGPWSKFAEERDALERTFMARAEAALSADTQQRRSVTQQCWREAIEAERRWLDSLKGRNAPSMRRRAYLRSWEKHDALACMAASAAA